MKKIFTLIIFLILVLSNLNFAYSLDTEEQKDEDESDWITPDNFILYKLDRAFERINLLLTFDRAERAKLGLEHARERILEAKSLIKEGKTEYLEELKYEHKKSIDKFNGDLSELEDEEFLDEEIEVELEEQENEIKDIKTNLRVTEKLNEEQSGKLNDFLDSLGNNVKEVKIKIKEDKVKIRIKHNKEKNDEEIKEEIEDEEELEIEKDIEELEDEEIDKDIKIIDEEKKDKKDDKIEDIKTEKKNEETKNIMPPLINTNKEIFVRTDGNDNNPGTKDRQLKTLVHAFELAVSGTTIKLGKGIYEGNYMLTSKNSDIIITDEDDYCTKTSSGKAFKGERPVVLSYKMIMSDGTDNSYNVFHLSPGVKNVRINCVTIKGVRDKILRNGKVPVGAELDRALDKLGDGAGTGIWNDGGINLVVTNTEITNNIFSGVYESGYGTMGSKYINNYVSNNGVIDNLDHGFYISSKNVLIEKNIVENNYAFGIQVYPGPENVKVLNNECAFNGKSGIVVGAEPNPLEPEIVGSEPKIAKNILVKGNTCHDNKKTGI